MKTVKAKKIDLNGAYHAEVKVSDKMKEAYDILKRMEMDKVVRDVRMGFDKVISLRTGSNTTNYYTASALQEKLEDMGLVVERNDCYNWFYVKEENDIDKYFRKEKEEQEDIEIIQFEARIGGGMKSWKKGEPMGENEERIKKAEKGHFVF